MLAFLKKLFFATFLLVLLIFLYENLEALGTKVPFVFDLFVEGWRYETPAFPVWILFAVFFLVGMLAAGFHGVYERMARRVELRRRDKRIRELEKELGEFRARAAELKLPEPGEGAASLELDPAAGRPVTAREPARGRRSGPPEPPPEEEPTL